MFAHCAFAVCNMDDAKVQDMLDRLRIEVACSAEGSLHMCQRALNGLGPNQEISLSQSLRTNSCTSADIRSGRLSPLALPAVASTGRLLEVINKRVASDRLVGSVEEFYEHTQKHRARVKALGMELFRSHPELFKGLDAWQVEHVLDAHDQAKVRPSVRAPDGRPFYQVLYDDGFGRELDRSIVDSLNARDKELLDRAEERFGVKGNPDLKANVERIEKIADFVDRGMSPVSPEEFGRKMEKASQYLGSAEDRELAKALEKKYFTITKDLQYKGLSPLRLSSLANRLYIQEHFSAAVSKYGAKNLSARSLAHAAFSGSRKLGAGFLKIMSSHGVATVLTAAEGPMLFFGEIKNTGCSERGYHDWVQDPNCQPAIGLTPKVIEFLGEDWETQKYHLQSDRTTCDVIKKTYQQSIKAPKIMKCQRGVVEFKTDNGDRILTRLGDDRNIRSVEFEKNSLLNKIYPLDRVRSVDYRSDGSVEQVCKLVSRKGQKKVCLGGISKEGEDASAFVRSMNYQIQKALHCCQPSNGFLETRCH